MSNLLTFPEMALRYVDQWAEGHAAGYEAGEKDAIERFLWALEVSPPESFDVEVLREWWKELNEE